jgi:hypothetical protein
MIAEHQTSDNVLDMLDTDVMRHGDDLITIALFDRRLIV